MESWRAQTARGLIKTRIAAEDLHEALARHQRWLDRYAPETIRLQPESLRMAKAGLR